MKSSRSFLYLVLVTLVLYGLAFAGRLQRYENRLTAFVGFGCYSEEVCWARENRALLGPGTLVYRTGGYDGQFYYYIAAALARGEVARLDAPPLRLSRIGYPLLAAVFAPAGPTALVIALLALPVLAHLIALFVLWRFYANRPESGAAGLALFALNPLSLYTTGLALADGLALALGVACVVACRREAGWGRPVAFVLAAAACLTKETMLALPLGFGVAALLGAIGSRRRVLDALFWGATLLPVFLYWAWIGFSPGMAANRGGLPFSGYFEFLTGGSGLAGGRAFLVLLLPAYVATGLYLAWRGRGEHASLELAGVLGAATALISFATANEYWANFANISRFFIPGLLPLCYLPVISGRWPRRLTLGLAGFLVVFSLVLVYAEFRAVPLPYHIY